MGELVTTRKVLLDVSIEQAWRLVTQSENVSRWYAPGGAAIELEPDGDVTFRWDEHGVYHGTVMAIEEPTRFGYRWSQFEDQPVREDNATNVEITLEAQAGDEPGTLVTIRERGYEQVAQAGVEPKELATAAAEAWAEALAQLQLLAAEA